MNIIHTHLTTAGNRHTSQLNTIHRLTDSTDITDTWNVSVYIHISPQMEIDTSQLKIIHRLTDSNVSQLLEMYRVQTTKETPIVFFGAITDTWNVSVYIHILDISTTGCIPPNKIL